MHISLSYVTVSSFVFYELQPTEVHMKLQVMTFSTSLTHPTWHKTTLKLEKKHLRSFSTKYKKYSFHPSIINIRLPADTVGVQSFSWLHCCECYHHYCYRQCNVSVKIFGVDHLLQIIGETVYWTNFKIKRNINEIKQLSITQEWMASLHFQFVITYSCLIFIC